MGAKEKTWVTKLEDETMRDTHSTWSRVLAGGGLRGAQVLRRHGMYHKVPGLTNMQNSRAFHPGSAPVSLPVTAFFHGPHKQNPA